MCTVCGCGPGETRIEGHAHEHEHEHIGPDGTVTRHTHHRRHGHSHDHDIQPSRLIRVEQDILAKNDRFAAVNRAALRGVQDADAQPHVQPRLRQDDAARPDLDRSPESRHGRHRR